MAAETSNDVAAETSDHVVAETSNDGTVLLSEEPKNGDWLIEIMEEQQKRMDKTRVEPEQPTRPKPRIPKVDKTLRETESNNPCFEPLVVSFGPYHHDNPLLGRMEPCKKDAAAWVISRARKKPANSVTGVEAISVYEEFNERVKKVSPSPSDWYDKDAFSHKFEPEEHFIRMMFLDGCFILYFIHLVVTGSSPDDYISMSSLQANIVRDVFLLENQIPFPILRSLMSLLHDQEIHDQEKKDQEIQEMLESSIIQFIFTVSLPSYEMNFSRSVSFRVKILIFKLFGRSVWKRIFQSVWKNIFKEPGKEPLHLLHVLREVLLGVRDSPGGSAGYWNYYFRPIWELKTAGIKVRRSKGMTLKHLKFKRGLLNSHLEIPQIIVNDSTMARLLNLVAFEMCPDGPKDRTVTSFIWLLHSLIDHAEDVKELQSENILLNRLSSGKDVSNLFKELATNLSPGSNAAYAHVINDIEDHYNRHLSSGHLSYGRMLIGEWIRQFKGTYFTSPWTLISLIAAVSVIALTLLQTIYTIWAFYKTY